MIIRSSESMAVISSPRSFPFCLLLSISPVDLMACHFQGTTTTLMIWEGIRKVDDPNTLGKSISEEAVLQCTSFQHPYQLCHSYWYGGCALYGGGASPFIQFPPQFVHTGAYA